ncbi:KpsF/GutQ family sugar-phosphate isomerase [Marinicella sp. W31]|uniref:KpsF/GutQ family sugar-phosphate isomerase n=1 Tax=Marinicella sp. W31 TaxID=3023713 RepID=UPI003757679E
MKNSSESIIAQAQKVISIEQQGLHDLNAHINDDFVEAVRMMFKCQGHIIVVGMGKSGHIGNKISATLASTGTPAFFVHPGEASHGDLGMITRDDVVLAISNSGETEEVLTILPVIKRMGVPLISITSKAESKLAKNSDIHLNVAIKQEACPLGLAPTTSTTVTLVLGDALAVTLLEMRGFTEEDFARSHPAGSLGKRLLLGIRDVMRTGSLMPVVAPGTHFHEALLVMTEKGLGMTAVVDADNHLKGVFTDGDLRRALDKGQDLSELTIDALATENPISIYPDKLAVEATQLMEQHNVHSLLVCDQENRLVGVLNVHDLMRAGVM